MCVDLQADSGFFCEGYSSDEDVIMKEEFRGAIVKQGCLLKQVSMMKERQSTKQCWLVAECVNV